MEVACLDLEGVLVPEIWVNVAERTGVDELRLTTRDCADYHELMCRRLESLERHGIGLPAIQSVIGTMEPLESAREFLDWLRSRFQVIILSDTFYEFVMPLATKLGSPTVFCHSLDVQPCGSISGYRLRQPDPKRAAVRALRSLNFRVIAAGDSYNDTGMLSEADAGIFFRPPPELTERYPDFPVTADYDEMRNAFVRASAVPAAR